MTGLLATATPMPVIIKSMVPEVVRSMPPQVIRSLPPVIVEHVKEGPNPWIAFAVPLALAAVGIAIGLWTLWKVYDQIRIATKQLSLAEDELAAVKDDFELARLMYDQSNKRPALELAISLLEDALLLFQQTYYRSASLDIALTNNGQKVAHNVLVEIYVPDSAFFTHPNLSQGWSADSMENIGGTDYRRVTYGDARLRVPIRGQRRWTWSPMLVPDVQSVTLLYRVYDDEYSYPEGWGRTTLQFTAVNPS